MPRRPPERGAVTILVLALLLAFVGLAAYAADIGLAYAEKRQQSIAADAAALAAARAVNDALPPGTACDSVALEANGDVQAAASTLNSANDLDGRSTVSSLQVNCTPTGTRGVEVTVRNSEPVPATLLNSPLLGVGSLQPPGGASALVFPADAGSLTELRPGVACRTTLANAITAGEPLLIEVNRTTGACDSAAGAEKWGYANFLDQGQFGGLSSPGSEAFFNDPCAGGNVSRGGDAVCQNPWLRDGYQGPFHFPIPSSGASTGLRGDSGPADGSVNLELTNLVGQEVLLPVANEFAAGPGDEGRLDVTGVMSAVVCAVHLADGAGDRSTAAPPCGPYPTPRSPGANALPTITAPNQPAGYFTDRWVEADSNPDEALVWVVPSQFVTSGAPLEPTGSCAVGDASCDFGVRAVQLWR